MFKATKANYFVAAFIVRLRNFLCFLLPIVFLNFK